MTTEIQPALAWRRRAAEELEALTPGDRRLPGARRLLELELPSERDALLDSHSEVLRDRLLAVRASHESGDPIERRVALERLLEEARRLGGRTRPLGRGFEELFESRLRRREAQRRRAPRLLELLDGLEETLLREPGEALRRLEEAAGRRLGEDELAWIEDERRARTLEWVRNEKTDGEGHICWYVTRDGVHGYRLARLGRPGFHVEPLPEARPRLAWSRGRVARIVYVPSTLAHQLGGVPEVGAAFVVSNLREGGWRADALQLMEADFDRGVPGLLEADVIGVGVYVHNKVEVAKLVARLREAGFAGAVVLGGPEARDLDAVRSTVSGWDAIVRGEGEEVLPEVLELLRGAERRGEEWLIERARSLRGVLLRWRGVEIHCDTVHRSRAAAMRHPLPFGWSRDGRRKLKMNFSRGCPYLCSFCPNHQGRRKWAGDLEGLWRFAVLAVADDTKLPRDLESELAAALAAASGGASGGLEASLDGFIAARERDPSRPALDELVRPIFAERLPGFDGDLAKFLSRRLELEPPRFSPVSTDADRGAWLLWKAAWLAAAGPDPERRFVIETSEDNTLVNRETVRAFLARRRRTGLDRAFVFNPGQNTIRDLLLDGRRVAEDYLDELVADNPFEIAFGADGTSNPVLRQNFKPGYGVAEIVALHRAIAARRITAEYNYILLTPETTLLEAVESFLLFLLLPIPWRDYDTADHGAINLRVIAEETTLATDEGILFAPDDKGHDVPLRDARLDALLERHQLSATVSSREVRGRLERVLTGDEEVRALVPLVIERWRRDFDGDAELVALAGELEGLSVEEIVASRPSLEARSARPAERSA